MTDILLSVSPSVFIWIMLGRGSSSTAFLLPSPEKGVIWPIPRRTHPARVAVIALMVTDLVSISRNDATGRATWRHLSSSPNHSDPTLWLGGNHADPTGVLHQVVVKSWNSLSTCFYGLVSSIQKEKFFTPIMFYYEQFSSGIYDTFAIFGLRTFHQKSLWY